MGSQDRHGQDTPTPTDTGTSQQENGRSSARSGHADEHGHDRQEGEERECDEHVVTSNQNSVTWFGEARIFSVTSLGLEYDNAT